MPLREAACPLQLPLMLIKMGDASVENCYCLEELEMIRVQPADAPWVLNL